MLAGLGNWLSISMSANNVALKQWNVAIFNWQWPLWFVENVKSIFYLFFEFLQLHNNKKKPFACRISAALWQSYAKKNNSAFFVFFMCVLNNCAFSAVSCYQANKCRQACFIYLFIFYLAPQLLPDTHHHYPSQLSLYLLSCVMGWRWKGWWELGGGFLDSGAHHTKLILICCSLLGNYIPCINENTAICIIRLCLLKGRTDTPRWLVHCTGEKWWALYCTFAFVHSH